MNIRVRFRQAKWFKDELGLTSAPGHPGHYVLISHDPDLARYVAGGDETEVEKGTGMARILAEDIKEAVSLWALVKGTTTYVMSDDEDEADRFAETFPDYWEQRSSEEFERIFGGNPG